jgi:hypothetical protein
VRFAALAESRGTTAPVPYATPRSPH